MKQIQKGFTLIELMIVVAIIGILAAVAIPAYQDYVVKAKLAKVQSTIAPIKLALAMYYQEVGSFPAISSSVSFPGGTALAAGDIWTSLGLSALPTLNSEISTLTTANTTATAAVLNLTLANIKAGATAGTCSGTAINACVLTMTGTPGATALVWANSGNVSGNPIAKKYFEIP